MAKTILTVQQLEMLDEEQIALYHSLSNMEIINSDYSVTDVFTKGIAAYQKIMGVEFNEAINEFLDFMSHTSIGAKNVFMKITEDDIPDNFMLAEGCSRKAHADYSKEDVW